MARKLDNKFKKDKPKGGVHFDDNQSFLGKAKKKASVKILFLTFHR
jgi:hypothetical protein